MGSDHAGFDMKQGLIERLADTPHDVVDLGTHSHEAVDYPDYAAAVGRAVVSGHAERGIIICGSGVGAAIACNKLTGVRCSLAHDIYSAHQSVEHDDANLLALGGRVIGILLAWDLVQAFLAAEFTGEERHQRRLAKLLALEEARE
jgi:RpiB/LacA/LacB family sugar-phosphate isomerase